LMLMDDLSDRGRVVSLCAPLVRHALEAHAKLVELLLARLAAHAPVDGGHALAVHLDLQK
jgi:hypothetical protein